MTTIEVLESTWRDAWSPFVDVAYLNTAAMSAMPRPTFDALQIALDAKRFPHHKSDATWFDITDRLRGSLAALIGASADQIALTTGASTGLQAVALGTAWQPGDEVIIAHGEFPVQHATWTPMAQREGVTVKVVSPRDRFLTADDLIDALTPNTRVVSVSHVRFDDGSLLDAARVAEACRARGVLFVLDVTQSCGAMPLDVDALGADFIVCAGYKWLLSPYGTGFLWARRDRVDALRPGPFYWINQDETSFAKLNLRDPAPRSGARRLDAPEMSSYFNLNVTAMEASVRFLVDVRPETVQAHNRELIARLFDELPDGFVPASPLDSTQRGPYGCFVAETPERTAAIHATLARENVFVSLREGRIRVSPHLFNTMRDIERLLDVVRAA